MPGQPGFGLSSSPPSTPNSNKQSSNTADLFRSLASNPSTTPAGPPPSSSRSFTPAGLPPPSSILGPTFGSSFAKGSYKPKSPIFGREAPRYYAGSDGDDEEDAEIQERPVGRSPQINFQSSPLSKPEPASKGVKRGRDATTTGQAAQASLFPTEHLDHSESGIQSIARSVAKGMKTARVQEKGSLILHNEGKLIKLHAGLRRLDLVPSEDLPNKRLQMIAGTSQELVELWQGVDASQNEGLTTHRQQSNPPPFSTATMIASLLLPLHNPPTREKGQDLSQSFGQSMRSSRMSKSGSLANLHLPYRPTPIPKVLLDWLNRFVDTSSDELDDLNSAHPNVTSHPSFWEIVLIATCHGRIPEVLQILDAADFQEAARPDEEGGRGYREPELSNIQTAINSAIALLRYCPALRNDWEVTGEAWAIFRARVSQALADLERLAEGEDGQSLASSTNSFSAPNFGIHGRSSNGGALSASVRKASSRVPWQIYTSLQSFYGLLQGLEDEIDAVAEDWLDASISYTIWWDGGDEFVDGDAYVRKLADNFDAVTSSTKDNFFQLNTADPVEVGLACALADDLEGVVNLLSKWSLPIATAVAEIAFLSGWMPMSGSSNLLQGFDETDLMVLDYARSDTGVDRDGLLVEYARGLSSRGHLDDDADPDMPDNQRQLLHDMDGWEFGVKVLARLENAQTANERVGDVSLTLLYSRILLTRNSF